MNSSYKGKNIFSDVHAFIHSWDNGDGKQSNVKLISYADNRINNHGEIENLSGTIFFPRDEQFIHSLELGVRDIVILFINEYHWITYNSCQSHFISPQWRIGILPRSFNEYNDIILYLSPLITTLQKKHILWAKVALDLHFLFDEKTEKSFDVVDITIESRFPYFIGKYTIFKIVGDLKNLLEKTQRKKKTFGIG